MLDQGTLKYNILTSIHALKLSNLVHNGPLMQSHLSQQMSYQAKVVCSWLCLQWFYGYAPASTHFSYQFHSNPCPIYCKFLIFPFFSPLKFLLLSKDSRKAHGISINSLVMLELLVSAHG
jgi:hypothetical protein